jgi:hypothetical protein
MALDPYPDKLGCENKFRHSDVHGPAVAFVRAVTDADGTGTFWTPRCQSCLNRLAAANPAAVRAHVVYIAADQPVADHDARPAVEFATPRADHDSDP